MTAAVRAEPFNRVRAPVAPGPEPLPRIGGLGHLMAFGRDPIATATRLFERSALPGVYFPEDDVHDDAARDEDGSALDEDELIGHVGAIFGAGHETSTNTLAWTLFLLAEHPDVASDLVAEDGELAGFFLPENSEVFLSIFHVHHDSAVFEAPDRFLPSRWSTIKPTAYEYIPFSAGPRMCIGAAFASMEIKVALAMLLQRFRVERLEKARIDHRVAITMAPKNGLRMRIRRADSEWASAMRRLPAVRGKIRELVELPS